MRAYRSMSVVVLLLAGAAQAVTTVSPLNDKGWEQGLVGSVGPSSGGVADVQGQFPEAPSPSKGPVQAGLSTDPDFLALQADHSLASPARGGEGPAGQAAPDLIRDVNAADWQTGHHWSTDPRKYSDVGFLNASSHVDLPALSDVGWVTTPLPVARETLIMEIVILPALGAVVLILAVALLVRRLRRRKPVDATRHLLQV